MKKFKLGIMFDSFVCHSVKKIESEGWYITPLRVEIDGKVYTEGTEEYDAKTLAEMVFVANNVKTSLPSLKEIEVKMAQASKDHQKVIVLPTSKSLSGTFNALKIESNKHDNVHVYENQLVGEQYIILAKKVEEMFDDDPNDFAQIDSFINDYISRSRTFILPRILDALIRGGRLQGAKKFLTQGLRLNLVLAFIGQPKVVALKKSMKKSYATAFKKLKKFILANGDVQSDYNYFLTHSNNKEDINTIQELAKEFNVKDFYSSIHGSAVILAHAGKGSLSLGVSPKVK